MNAPAQKLHFIPEAARPRPPQLPHSTRPADFFTDLAVRIKRGTQCEVMTDLASRGRYATDASIYQIMPLGVAVPRTEDDLKGLIDLAAEQKIPLLPRGGGTSQCGQTTGEALVIDCSKYLNQSFDFDADKRQITVQPGMVLDHLNARLKPHGLWFPVDVSTAAQATIGGMAGNNSCGSRSIAYGNMVHNVAAIDLLLADGSDLNFGRFDAPLLNRRARDIVTQLHTIADREKDEIARVWPKVLRRVAGYNLDVFHPQSERPYVDDGVVNLAHLLVGAEGTLGLSRRITLNLAPLPNAKTLGVVNFNSFYQAMALTQHIVKLKPVAVELVDRTMIELARGNPAFKPVIEKALLGAPEAILLVEFAGESREAQLKALADLVTLMADLGLPGSVVEMPDEKAQKALWEVRKAGLNIMMSMKGDGKPISFIEDCAVPLEHLADYSQRLTEVFAKHGTKGTWYAHASVGTLHVRPVLDLRSGDATKMRAIAEEAGAMVREYKGAFSGEHGDGIARGEWVSWQYGPRILQAFEEIKALFDPHNLMNPGKIVATPKMDEAALFRFPPGYAALPLQPVLDWSKWNVRSDPVTERETAPGTGRDATGGLASAVEMCNNNGHCRKFDAGTMCPSYRATRNEKDLTRGRANTLRLALSGQLGPDAFTSDAMHETMDLCVGCKGCKRDCPTGVDMAKMKVEFLHHYKARHGHTLKDKLIAHLPRYAPIASRMALVANLGTSLPGAGWLREMLLGFAKERSLPKWARQAFTVGDRGSGSGDRGAAARLGPVVLLPDTFNNYFEPENLHAAQRVLEAAGYAVTVAGVIGERPLCCGRTYLASGMVDEAKKEAARTVAALKPFIEAGTPIVGLEPSCLLTLRDEFLVMNLGELAPKLAEQSFLFEEFLAREHGQGRLTELVAKLKPLPESKALLHGHCHQKAFDAVTPILLVLELIPGLKTELIESSCCGMAGSFGYEKDHLAVSMQMAEASLLPALRKADAETLIVADGTSCRHQIADGAGRGAVHVAQLLDRALGC